MGKMFARLDTGGFGNVSTWKIIVQMLGKEAIQLGLHGTFSVVQQEGD
jgi:hypothetical protein